MAQNPLFRMTMQAADDSYYQALENRDGNSWDVSSVPDITYLQFLPEGWDTETNIDWERDKIYLGVMRSRAGGYKWYFDGRAIIQKIRNEQGLRGYCFLKIWMWNESAFSYDLFYPSYLDFKTCHDDLQTEYISIGTLDNGLIKEIHGYGDTAYNMPIWKNTGTPTSPVWELDEATWVKHFGIKLLYNSTFISSTSILNDPPSVTDYRGQMGFNQGKHDTPGSPDDGYHITPILSQYSPVQNNGATTFIGNDILQPFLPTGSQSTGETLLAGPVGGFPAINEENFSGINNARPYTTGNNSLKNATKANVGVGAVTAFTLQCAVSGTFAWPNPADVALYLLPYYGKVATTGAYVRFVLFEIDSHDNPVTVVVGGQPLYTYQTILELPLPDADVTVGSILLHNGGRFSNYPSGTVPLMDGTGTALANPSTVNINPDKAYVFGIIFDKGAAQGGDPATGLNHSSWWAYGVSDVQFSFLANYNSGTAAPVTAPSFPASVFAGFRLATIFGKIVKNLATRRANDYGFPIPVATPYSFQSDYLTDPTAVSANMTPWQIVITSGYCIHDLQGQSYVTMSFNNAFDFCKKIAGCGGGIEGDVFRVEPLQYFFRDVMILDLGYDIFGLEIDLMTEGIGANFQDGFSKVDTNQDFGIDEFNTQRFFNTPVSEIPGTMNYRETAVMCAMYPIEKIRAQRVAQPIGTSYDPASPSGDNTTIAIYIAAGAIDTETVYDPSNNPRSVSTIPVKRDADAQSGDPTAASAPYVRGLYYPDTAINKELAPCLALKRGLGALLHSELDNMDTEYLTFRNTTIMQYNNTVALADGNNFAINLNVGAGESATKQFADVLIGDLPPQLFKPYLLKFKSKYPVNLWRIFNTAPNYSYGYVRFLQKNKGYGFKEYKGFIAKATQSAGNSAPTEFELWAHPGTVL